MAAKKFSSSIAKLSTKGIYHIELIIHFLVIELL